MVMDYISAYNRCKWASAGFQFANCNPDEKNCIMYCGFVNEVFMLFYNIDFHQVKKVKVGLPIVHDSHSYEGIIWKVNSIVSYFFLWTLNKVHFYKNKSE